MVKGSNEKKKSRSRKGDGTEPVNWKVTIMLSLLIAIGVAFLTLFFTKVLQQWLTDYLNLDPNISFFITQFLQYFFFALLMVVLYYWLIKKFKDSPPPQLIFR